MTPTQALVSLVKERYDSITGATGRTGAGETVTVPKEQLPRKLSGRGTGCAGNTLESGMGSPMPAEGRKASGTMDRGGIGLQAWPAKKGCADDRSEDDASDEPPPGVGRPDGAFCRLRHAGSVRGHHGRTQRHPRRRGPVRRQPHGPGPAERRGLGERGGGVRDPGSHGCAGAEGRAATLRASDLGRWRDPGRPDVRADGR